MAAARDRAAAARCRREGQASRARYFRRDDLGLGARAGPRRAGIRARTQAAARSATIVGSTLLRRHGRRARQRRARALRRDGRLARRLAVASRRVDRARGARARRGARCRREPLLRAVALGYDVGTRLTMALGGVEFRNDTRRSTHAFAGTFGAAAAAGCAPGSTRSRCAGCSTTRRSRRRLSPSGAATPTTSRRRFVFGGMPARNGVTAALLVSAGWNGVDDVFSGDDNFFAVNAPDGRPGVLVDGARRALRDRQHRHQEVDRRHTDPGAARRDRELCDASIRSPPTT